MSTRLEVRSIHESITYHHSITPLWCPARLPTRRHAIALTLILVCFKSIRFKLSNNKAKLSKQSITAYTAIRIVLLTLQGCTTTHMKCSVAAFGLNTIQAGVGEDNFHNLYLIANSSSMEPLIWAGFHIVNPAGLPVWSKKMYAGSQDGLNIHSSTLQTVPQTYQNLRTNATH